MECMTHKAIQRQLVICLAAFMVVALALAQDSSALIGKWNMTSETDGDPVKWTLVLKETDGQLAAFLATDQGEVAAREFTYKDGLLKFKTTYQGEDYVIELKSSGTKLNGTWSGGGSSGATYGTKAS